MFPDTRPARLHRAAIIAMLLVCAPLSTLAASEVMGCLITPSKTVEIGSPTVGVIERMTVERGDTVLAGQLVVALRAGVEKAHVDLATLRAGANAELQAAVKAQATAHRKLTRTQDLYRKEFVSAQAVDQAQADEEAAEARHNQAIEQTHQAEKELGVATAELQTRLIRSPISGIVIDVYRHPGERVEEKPMLKVARIDPLYAEVILPAEMFGRVKAGQDATIQPDLPGAAPSAGKIALVDQIIEPASNTFRARIVVPNPGGRIPAGLRCQATLPQGERPASIAAIAVPQRP